MDACHPNLSKEKSIVLSVKGLCLLVLFKVSNICLSSKITLIVRKLMRNKSIVKLNIISHHQRQTKIQQMCLKPKETLKNFYVVKNNYQYIKNLAKFSWTPCTIPPRLIFQNTTCTTNINKFGGIFTILNFTHSTKIINFVPKHKDPSN